ncbi:MAG: hypothetical protein LC725_04510, partial [Lentisphaerae bacterium]|nr:hypothetical protein [Lentisphaerota bacterium]
INGFTAQKIYGKRGLLLFAESVSKARTVLTTQNPPIIKKNACLFAGGLRVVATFRTFESKSAFSETNRLIRAIAVRQIQPNSPAKFTAIKKCRKREIIARKWPK